MDYPEGEKAWAAFNKKCRDYSREMSNKVSRARWERQQQDPTFVDVKTVSPVKKRRWRRRYRRK